MPSIPEARNVRMVELIDRSEALERRMAALQGEESPAPAEVESVRRDYRTWHVEAAGCLPQESVEELDAERDGTWFTTGIKVFLSDPRAESPFMGDDGSFPLGRWQHPFPQVRERLERQRSLLQAVASEGSENHASSNELAAVLRRVPDLIRTLGTDASTSFDVPNEKALQVVVEGLLRTLYDDVRPEDPAPTHAGASSRIDFVLPEARIAVETKMTRQSLTARRLGEELRVDAGRYPRHPDCDAIIALVYDPDRLITNPRGVEADLTSQASDGTHMICVITS